MEGELFVKERRNARYRRLPPAPLIAVCWNCGMRVEGEGCLPGQKKEENIPVKIQMVLRSQRSAEASGEHKVHPLPWQPAQTASFMSVKTGERGEERGRDKRKEVRRREERGRETGKNRR